MKTRQIKTCQSLLIALACVLPLVAITAPPKKPTYELQNQKYKVFKVVDSSFGKKMARATIELYAPTAKTVEQRRDTIMMAATAYHMDGYTVAAVFARLWESPKQKALLAMVNYHPHGCGWTGNDCDGRLWSDLRVSTAKEPTYMMYKGKKIYTVERESFYIPHYLANWRGIYQGPKQHY